MRLIDEELPRQPFYGSRKMTAYLNRKRIQRLQRFIGEEKLPGRQRE
jgi:hypothetical protein